MDGNSHHPDGFEVDRRLAALMNRPDWKGRRISEAWLCKFPAHPDCGNAISFVDLISIEHAMFENRNIRHPRNRVLNGRPDAEFPPGDFDPAAGYLIGFTDYVDSAICVDLRPERGPRIIYENRHRKCSLFSTAFETLDAFVEFYVEQNGP